MPDSGNGHYAIELKRYGIKPDGWEAFLSIWKRIVTVRKRHGFAVPFAYADREKNMFTWAVSHDEFDHAARLYYDDPERVELDVVRDFVDAWEIRRVEQMIIP